MQKDCQTKYPLLFIHGAGFRDGKKIGYWGRIPKALTDRGAKVYHGGQERWATVEENAAMLKNRLTAVLADGNVKKVNIIAHSKGGVEARFLASSLGCAGQIASIVTVSTLHHGSPTMDKLTQLPRSLFRAAGVVVNACCRLGRDRKPDFYMACIEMTTAHMKAFNAQNPDVPGVYYESHATAMGRASSDMFLFLPALAVGWVEGENDGLLSPESARWTNFKGVWRSGARRGISHADAVDARRRNFARKTEGSGIIDVREPYLEIVRRLKAQGL